MRVKSLIRRTGSVFLSVIFLLTCLTIVPIQVNTIADETSNVDNEQHVKKIINVVYDTSGSMCVAKNKRTIIRKEKKWCQAKYAMGVFTSMMDFGKNDSLRIFPMHPVTIGEGSKEIIGPNSNQKYVDFDQEAGDYQRCVDKISNIYTCGQSLAGTPFQTVRDAANDLKAMQTDGTEDVDYEKWLVILTDGAFNDGVLSNGKLSPDYSESKTYDSIRDVIKDSKINVEYIRISDDNDSDLNNQSVSTKEEKKIQTITCKPSADAIIESLVKACNRIFDRDIYPASDIEDDTLKLDVSMKRIIVFAQGNDVNVTSLGGESPKPNVEVKYSETKGKSEDARNGEVDKGLRGVVSTFDTNFKSGNDYKIEGNANLSDKKKCMVCYEPDVSLRTTLTQLVAEKGGGIQDGKTYALPVKSLPEGKYRVNIGLYDNQTNKKIESEKQSKLVGPFKFYEDNATNKEHESYFTLGDKKQQILKDGQIITISGSGESGSLVIRGTYGKRVKYKINTENNDDFKIKVEENLELELENNQDWCLLSNLEKGKGIDAIIFINKKEVTDANELEKIDLNVTSNKEHIAFDTKLLQSKSNPEKCRYRIKLKYYDGDIDKTDTWKHKITVTARLNKSKGIDSTTVRIWTWWQIAIACLLLAFIIAVLAVLIVLWMKYRRTKIGPDDIRRDPEQTYYYYGGERQGEDDWLEEGEENYRMKNKDNLISAFKPKIYSLDIVSASPYDIRNQDANYGVMNIVLTLEAKTERKKRGSIKNELNVLRTLKIIGYNFINEGNLVLEEIYLGDNYKIQSKEINGVTGWYLDGQPLDNYIIDHSDEMTVYDDYLVRISGRIITNDDEIEVSYKTILKFY